MNNNPWSEIKIPEYSYTARVAQPDHPYEFYWARDIKGNYLFLLHSSENIIVPAKIPKPNGIDISVGQIGGESKDQLVLTLNNKENTDIFYSLCSDLMNATKSAVDEKSVVAIIIRRMERWQQFLKTNRNKIDEKALRGLLGELYFMKNYLLKIFTPQECIEFWHGPLGDIHDFGIGKTSIEVKTKSSTKKAVVTISSAEQLHCNLEALYLFVLTVSRCSKQDENAITVPELVEQIHSVLSEYDLLLSEAFDTLLMASGYIDIEEYKEMFFITDKGSIFAVLEDFPKLALSDIPDGVEHVRYDLNITKCHRFLTSSEDFTESIKADHG